MKISQARQITVAAIQASMALTQSGGGRDAEYITPFWVSGPGLGKSTSLRNIALSLNLEPITLIGSQYDPAELSGWSLPIPNSNRMQRSIPDWFPDGSVATLLILDELPQSTVAVQNIFSQLVNERRVGPHKLPDNCFIVAAGNRTSDRAGTNTIPTHLRDRLQYLEIEADLEDTIAYFSKVGVDERVCGYLRNRPEYLHQFDKDADACPSPRSWERVSTILKFNIDPLCMAFAINGQVGKAASADFQTYLKVTSQMPDLDYVIANPAQAPIPSNVAITHAVCAGLSRRMKDGNAANILAYLSRLPQKEFMAFVMKDALNRDGDLKKSTAVRQWVLTEGKSLIL